MPKNNFGARYYDPTISVWHGVDPLASKYPSYSPYNYTLNNPIRYIDPDGRSVDDVIELDKNNNVVKVTPKAGPNEVYNHEGKRVSVNNNTESATNVKIGDKVKSGELYRKVDGLDVLRQEINLKGEDQYGHWWTEMDYAGEERSYGWWPKEPVGYTSTVMGVEGELNGITNFGGEPNMDPHHGDRSPGTDHYNVYSSNSINGNKSAVDIKSDIIIFSYQFSGKWSWPFGQNCHSFQEKFLNEGGLKVFPASQGLPNVPSRIH